METLRFWLKGVRLYIAVATLLVTVLIIWWAHAVYAGGTQFPTRIEETYAWLSTGLIVLALSIGPFYKLFPVLPGRGLLFDARRLIGVSAAWFAALHVGIAYISLFRHANPLSLPSGYQRSFLAGGIAMLILSAMALTSFDTAFKVLGIWWFRLHRFIYLAAGLVLLHAFIIGVHTTELPVLIILTVVSAALLFAYVGIMVKARRTTTWQLLGTVAMIVYLLIVLAYGFEQHGGRHI